MGVTGLVLHHPMTCKQLARLVVSGGSCVLHIHHRVLHVLVPEPVSHKRHIGSSIDEMQVKEIRKTDWSRALKVSVIYKSALYALEPALIHRRGRRREIAAYWLPSSESIHARQSQW